MQTQLIERTLLLLNQRGKPTTHAELLEELQVQPYQLDYALQGLLAQRLVRRLDNAYALPVIRFEPEQPLGGRPRSPIIEKRCVACKELKMQTDFYGIDTKCKACRKSFMRGRVKTRLQETS